MLKQRVLLYASIDGRSRAVGFTLLLFQLFMRAVRNGTLHVFFHHENSHRCNHDDANDVQPKVVFFLFHGKFLTVVVIEALKDDGRWLAALR